MPGPNFDIISGLEYTDRMDYYLVDPTILMPTSTNPLVDGEWLELDASLKLKRGTSMVANNESTTFLCFPSWSETGRFEVQSIQKVPVIRWSYFEARTAVINNTGCTVGTPLIVQDITFKGIAGRRGLAKCPTPMAPANHVIYAYWEKAWSFPGGIAGAQILRMPTVNLVQ